MNRVSYFDLYASNPERAIKFYEEVFGWTFEKWNDPDLPEEYWSVKTGSDDHPGIDGGMIKRRGPDPGKDIPIRAFVCSIEVDNIDEYIMKVKEMGSVLAMDKTPVKGFGHVASFIDPEGNSVGLMHRDESTK